MEILANWRSLNVSSVLLKEKIVRILECAFRLQYFDLITGARVYQIEIEEHGLRNSGSGR